MPQQLMSKYHGDHTDKKSEIYFDNEINRFDVYFFDEYEELHRIHRLMGVGIANAERLAEAWITDGDESQKLHVHVVKYDYVAAQALSRIIPIRNILS